MHSKIADILLGNTRRKMQAAHVLGALLLVALVALIQIQGLWRSYRQYQEHARLTSQNLGNVTAEAIGGFFRNVDITLLAAIDQARLQEHGATPEKLTFNDVLVNLKNQVPGLSSLRITDADGVVQFRSDQDITDQYEFSVADREYFQRLKVNPRLEMIISEPIIGHLNNTWTLACARPFYGADGKFGGIVFAAIELDHFAENVMGTKIDLGGQGIFALIDNNKNTIVSYSHSAEFRNLIGKKIVSPSLQDLVVSNVDSAYYEARTRRDGIERITYFKRIPGLPLNVVVSLGRDEAFSGWLQERRQAVLMSLIFTAFACFGSWLLYRARIRNVLTLDALAGASNFNRKVIDNSSVGIHVHRQDGSCIMVNAALCDMLGLKEEELLRTNYRELACLQGTEAVKLADKSLASGATHHLQARVQVDSGKALWLQWVFASFLDRGERHLLVLVRDITDIQEAREELETSNRKLAVLSATDGLTGLANRRHFDEALVSEWRRSTRHRQPLALAMIDVDLFKLYNDHFGHLGGDECLRQVARVLQHHIGRAGDVVARYGGEEFAFIGPATDIANVKALTENIRAALEKLAVPHPLSPFGCVTLSIGVAAMVPTEGQTPDQLVRRADEALYLAKQQGRNQVVCAP